MKFREALAAWLLGGSRDYEIVQVGHGPECAEGFSLGRDMHLGNCDMTVQLYKAGNGMIFEVYVMDAANRHVDPQRIRSVLTGDADAEAIAKAITELYVKAKFRSAAR